MSSIENFMTQFESWIRLGSFVVAFGIFATVEFFWPRRPLQLSKPRRWLANFGLIFFNTVLVRLLVPSAVIGVAFWVQTEQLGLFNQWLQLPWLVEFIAGIIILDLVIYLQHVVFHFSPWLWRLHRMHHSDPDFDVSTALRFHPLEILISLAVKIFAVIALGVSPATVIVFEIVLNATAMFNHANWKLSPGLDKLLRYFIVTPDMHRVHHSVIERETNSNFGFNLPWWDFLFRTYRSDPALGHEEMHIGLEQFRSPNDQSFGQLILQPLKRTN